MPEWNIPGWTTLDGWASAQRLYDQTQREAVSALRGRIMTGYAISPQPTPNPWAAMPTPAPTTTQGAKMFQIPPRIMNTVLERQGLPKTVDLYNLPSRDDLVKIKRAVKRATEQIHATIKSISTEELANYGVLFDIMPDGELVKATANDGTSLRLSLTDYRFTRDLVEARIGEHLPDWAEIRWSPNIGRVSIVAKESAGNLRSRVIDDLLATHNAQNRYDQISNSTYIDSDGSMYYVPISYLYTLETFTRKLKAEYIDVMRAMFKREAQQEAPPKPTHDTSEGFKSYMHKRAAKLATDELLINQMPILPHGTAVGLTWGIEVEAAGARGVSAPDNWDRKGDSSLHSAYNGDERGTRYVDPEECEYNMEHREQIEDRETGNMYDNPDWEDPAYCEYCGDVERDYDDYDDDDDDYGDTAEFVSPILHSFHSQGLEKLIKKLIQEPQNDSAGVHVHVGAAHLTPRQIGSLVLGYQMIEPMIEASYQRDTREYCNPRTTNQVVKVLKSAKTAKYTISPDTYNDRYGYNSNGTVVSYGDRYHSVNLSALAAHGTVEFRAMGPVYDYETLIKWASFCREMVQSAANGAKPSDWSAVKDWAGLMRVFAKYGSEYAKAEFAEIKQATEPELRVYAANET